MTGAGDGGTVYYRERSRVLIAAPTVALGTFALLIAFGALLTGEFGTAWTSFGMGFLMTCPFWVFFVRPRARLDDRGLVAVNFTSRHRIAWDEVADISLQGLLTVELRDGRRIVCDGVRSERTWPSPKAFPEAFAFAEEAKRRWRAAPVE